jgi:putative heme iron utilization protein
MADATEAPQRPTRAAILWQARCLLRDARAGTLATADDGQPYAALVTPAPAPDLSLLLLLSGLSAHTSHLQADGRCALMVMGAPTSANPQTAPRLTVTGTASLEEDPALKARWVARHPYAGFYADLGDFRLYRLRPSGGQFIGGFASAHRLNAADLQPDPAAVAAVAEAEADILAHVNADHADALAHIAGSPGWRMVAADVDGCDLAQEEIVLRVPWSAPVADAAALRGELVRLAERPAPAQEAAAPQ